MAAEGMFAPASLNRASSEDGLSADEASTREMQPLHDGAVVLQRLTARELEVLKGVSYGYSNPQIAAALRITVDGVKFHLKIIYGKLGAERRVHAVRIAEQCGLIRPRGDGVIRDSAGRFRRILAPGLRSR